MQCVTWKAGPDGRYWIDAALGSQSLRLMIDLGLVDPADQVGLVVRPGVFETLKRRGELSNLITRFHRSATGHVTSSESGLVRGHLIVPGSELQFGPAIEVYVSCGASNVPDRVGVVFFHRLGEGKATWKFAPQVWEFQFP